MFPPATGAWVSSILYHRNGSRARDYAENSTPGGRGRNEDFTLHLSAGVGKWYRGHYILTQKKINL
jgi:hypothetical protein